MSRAFRNYDLSKNQLLTKKTVQERNRLIKPVKKSISQSINAHSSHIPHYQKPWEKR